PAPAAPAEAVGHHARPGGVDLDAAAGAAPTAARAGAAGRPSPCAARDPRVVHPRAEGRAASGAHRAALAVFAVRARGGAEVRVRDEVVGEPAAHAARRRTSRSDDGALRVLAAAPARAASRTRRARARRALALGEAEDQIGRA